MREGVDREPEGRASSGDIRYQPETPGSHMYMETVKISVILLEQTYSEVVMRYA